MATETITQPGTQTHVIEDTDEAYEPVFHLILLDDDSHTYQYVIIMLGAIFGYSRNKAFAIACMVDNDGQAILMTGPKSELEPRQEQIHAFGADPLMENSAGSMSAILEPVV